MEATYRLTRDLQKHRGFGFIVTFYQIEGDDDEIAIDAAFATEDEAVEVARAKVGKFPTRRAWSVSDRNFDIVACGR